MPAALDARDARPAPDAPQILPIDDGAERLGWIAIDSTVRGRARGGLRLVPDLTPEELADAARAMTLKYGLLGLPQGGGKAGVLGDPDAPLAQRRERLLRFGRAALPLLRAQRYVPDADIGTRAEDMRWMFESLGLSVGAREWRGGDSGLWTACSVLAATRAALAHRGRSLAGATIAIEGFGAVGSSLARLAHFGGARVVAVSTSLGAVHDPRGLDVTRLLELARRGSGAVIEGYDPCARTPREALLELPVDVLSPCARRHSVTPGNAGAVRARFVVPGANNPLTPEAERGLEAGGALCVPDFVANCGGVLGGTMAFAAIPPQRIERFLLARIEGIIGALLERAAASGDSPRTVAEAVATARSARVREAALRAGWRARLFEAALAAHRRGFLPAVLSGALAPGFFDRLVRNGP